MIPVIGKPPVTPAPRLCEQELNVT